MKKIAALLGVLLCASIAQAQPDNGPGMAVVKPPEIPQPQPVRQPTAAERREANRAVYNAFNHPTGKLNLSSPEATVRSCLWAMENADYKTARQCVQHAQPYEKLRDLEEAARKDYESAPMGIDKNLLITDLHSHETDDAAVVTFRTITIAGFMRDAPTSVFLFATNERFLLKRVGTNWLIQSTYKPFDPFDPFFEEVAPKSATDLFARAIGVLVHPDIVVQQEPFLVCQSNLKQIGRAVYQYAQDFDEKFPSSDDWQKQLLPYIRDDQVFHQIFHCPVSKEDRAGYGYNEAFENKTLGDIAAPAQIIFLYEGKDRKFDFRHQIGDQKLTTILFADGHVQTFTEKTLEAALKDKSVSWTP